MHEIAVLHAGGCAGGVRALEIAEAIAATRDDVAVTDVLIERPAQAVSAGFRGSPTVLVDGVEVAPDARVPLGSMG